MDSADDLVQFDTPYGIFWTREHDFVTSQLREFGGHQLSELGMIRSLSRQGDVILDVGAHIGTFCIPLAKHIGSSGRIHAFEPTPDSYRLLLRNIDANDLAERARATNALISDAKVEYAVHYSSDHSCAATRGLGSSLLMLFAPDRPRNEAWLPRLLPTLLSPRSARPSAETREVQLLELLMLGTIKPWKF